MTNPSNRYNVNPLEPQRRPACTAHARATASAPTVPRTIYGPPHLITIASADELLDVLGPAQAGYGGGPP